MGRTWVGCNWSNSYRLGRRWGAGKIPDSKEVRTESECGPHVWTSFLSGPQRLISLFCSHTDGSSDCVQRAEDTADLQAEMMCTLTAVPAEPT